MPEPAIEKGIIFVLIEQYILKATEHLEAFIADCDRRTTAAKQRLAETQEELSAEVTEKANAVHELAEQIGQKLARAEALGEEGMVEESVKLMGEVPNLFRMCMIFFLTGRTSCIFKIQ